MASCCGRMSLPFGAEASIGVTRITRSPFDTSPEKMRLSARSFGKAFPSASLISQIPDNCTEEQRKPPFIPSLNRRSSSERNSRSRLDRQSDLVRTRKAGICSFWSEERKVLSSFGKKKSPSSRENAGFFAKCFSHSSRKTFPESTIRAMSVSRITSCVRSTRIAPSSPSSSNPAVSSRTTGPSGRISIVFLTGSVVVPGISETRETGCPAMAFIRLDFPAFLLPKKLI